MSGAGTLLLHDIDGAKAEKLGRDIRSATKTQVHALDASDLRLYAPNVDCIINATPLGLRQADPLPLSRELIRKGQLVCDLVYNHPDTRFLKAACSRSASILRGIGMLLYQGVIAFEVWTGKKAPVTVMKNALSSQILGR